MDISSLSQELNLSLSELRKRMAQAGFRVSERARKIDNTLAKEIIEKLRPQPARPAAVSARPAAVQIPSVITVRELSALLRRPPAQVIKSLISNGVMASLNEQVDYDAAAVVASDLGFEPSEQRSQDAASGTVADVIASESADQLVLRPPIVAVMGHVDHGKTKLLDTIRSTNVIDTEAGAITQHIGAYKVEIPIGESKSKDSGTNRDVPRQAHPSDAAQGDLDPARTGRENIARKTRAITFLDTPGHEAFAAMRARGANVTDLIVLVVAADDGVKQQTLEVINRARMTKTPMIVAINKIDKPEANPELVKSQLSEAGVVPEEWGGKTIFVPISARQNIGIDKLLDMILLTAEVENYRANPNGTPIGTVIESNLSKTQGPVATVIVQNGTLSAGNIVAVGGAYGRIRTLEDEHGRALRSAGPSVPARISGLSSLPEVGDILRTYPDPQSAQAAATAVLRSRTAKRLAYKSGISADVENQQLNLIIKADVQGSLEAILQELSKLENQDVKVQIVSQGIGDINETDVLAAESARASLIGFNNSILPSAAKLAKQKRINVDLYDVIYELTEDITQAILQLVLPEVEHVVTGRLKVLAVFARARDHQIVGGVVTEGSIVVERKLSIYRGEKKIGEGKLAELQRNKQSVRTVESGSECGLNITTKNGIEKGDIIVMIEERLKEKRLKRVSEQK